MHSLYSIHATLRSGLNGNGPTIERLQVFKSVFESVFYFSLFSIILYVILSSFISFSTFIDFTSKLGLSIMEKMHGNCNGDYAILCISLTRDIYPELIYIPCSPSSLHLASCIIKLTQNNDIYSIS